MNLENKIIPIFFEETKCPFSCKFCNTKTANGEEASFNSINQLKNQIEASIKTIKNKGKDFFVEIGFFGGTFTCISIEEMRIYLDIAENYVKEGNVNGIRISTRPDFFGNEILDFLKSYTITTVEFGVQSFNNTILKELQRGHSAETAIEAINKSKEAGYKTSVHLMCGLPFENELDFLNTIKKTVQLKPDYVRIHPLVVMKGTFYEKSNFVAPSCEEIIERLSKGVYLLEKNNIKVIKLGLQPTDSLNKVGNVLSGCYNQSLKHLVYSFIFKKYMEKLIFQLKNESEIEISKSDYSYYIGYKKMNYDIFKKFSNIKTNGNLKTCEIKVENNIKNIFMEELFCVD